MELFVLDFAILGLLMERARHGYELKRALGELGFWKVSFGSLYPALRRLEKRGAIEATGGTGRRKSYRITDSGRELAARVVGVDEVLRGELRQGIGREERQALSWVLTRLQVNLQSAINQ